MSVSRELCEGKDAGGAQVLTDPGLARYPPQSGGSTGPPFVVSEERNTPCPSPR